MTSNISHSITTSTNGGPQSWYNIRIQSWYNTRSSPQLVIHSHRVHSMRILDLILLTILVLILLTRLSLILLTRFTIQHHHLNHMRIHRTWYDSQVRLDITHKFGEWLLILYNQHKWPFPHLQTPSRFWETFCYDLNWKQYEPFINIWIHGV